MWNCDWEYQHRDVLKNCYERKMAGRSYGKHDPIHKIICEGCVFYTWIWSKKYCCYKKCDNIGYRKQLRQWRLAEPPRTQVCKVCKNTFTSKRSDALYCSNACRQRTYRQVKADNALLRELKSLIKRLMDAMKSTVPAIAEATETVHQKMIIFRNQLLHRRGTTIPVPLFP